MDELKKSLNLKISNAIQFLSEMQHGINSERRIDLVNKNWMNVESSIEDIQSCWNEYFFNYKPVKPETQSAEDYWKEWHSEDMTFKKFKKRYFQCSTCGGFSEDPQCICYAR